MTETQVDMAGLFALAEEAFEMHCAELKACATDEAFGTRSDDDDSDEESATTSLQRMRCVRLPDGDMHLCGPDCAYTIDTKDGHCVCKYTGLVVGRSHMDRTDHSTGRSTWSADPDMQCGPAHGGMPWQKKRDMMQASRTAYSYARTLDDAEMPRVQPTERAVRPATKRGALCVDEVPAAHSGPKRVRTSKKNVQSNDMLRSLHSEALRTLGELLTGGSTSGTRASATASDACTVDPRLLDSELLFNAALRKYMKEVMSAGGAPTVDDVHNIALAVQRVIEQEQRKQSDTHAARGGLMTDIKFRESAARLAVALWSGACQTPYLEQARRGADSFRPFCAGAFYAFKRGLTLVDGTVLVPRVAEFADALPTQRAIAADPASKSLHASSHRGLCTIHRCIASVDAPTAQKLFAETVSACRALPV